MKLHVSVRFGYYIKRVLSGWVAVSPTAHHSPGWLTTENDFAGALSISNHSKMCAMKSAMKLALLALLKDNAKLAAGAPSCRRVASQWTMVFTEECTSWFSKDHSKAHRIPAACEQVRG